MRELMVKLKLMVDEEKTGGLESGCPPCDR